MDSRNAGPTGARTPKSARPDLTHAEAAAAFLALSKTVGSACQVYVHLSSSLAGPALDAEIYTKGIARSGGATLSVRGNSYRELLAACEAKWAEHSDLHGSNVIRELALAIIAITADQGECSAALKANRAALSPVEVSHAA